MDTGETVDALEASQSPTAAATSSSALDTTAGPAARPLNRLRRGTEDPETCVICLKWPKRKAALDGCSHTSFCLSCINSWAETNNCCPVCRTPFHAAAFCASFLGANALAASHDIR